MSRENRFTESARRVLGYAKEEAVRLRDNYVSTEHLLLGLMREDCTAVRILGQMGLTPDHIRSEADRGPARWPECRVEDVQFTPRAERILYLAYVEARILDRNVIGTEHLLLGMIREGEGLAALVLKRLGVDLEATRRLAALSEQ